MSRNVVLVSIDSLRADHCGFMGYEKDTTPTLDSMAEDGLVFENAVAPGPATPESMPATFTGHYPIDRQTKAREVAGTTERFQAHLARHETIAEWFSDQGYATAGFTPNPWTCRHFGFDRGFDYFQDFLDQDRSSGIWERMLAGQGSKPLTALRLVSNWSQREATFKPWSSFYDEIVEWTRNAPEPYFLWVFLLDPHFPYLPSNEHRSQSRWRTYEANLRLYLESQTTPYSPRVHEQLVTAYDDAIRYTDDFFQRLRSDLADDDPAIVIHADHGEAFGEHGTYGHHDQLYDANVKVPLVVSGVPSETVTEPVSVRSIPDIAERVATGSDPTSVARPSVLTRTGDGSMSAVRATDWSYIANGTGGELLSINGGTEQAVEDSASKLTARDVWQFRNEPEREKRRVATAVDTIVEENIL